MKLFDLATFDIVLALALIGVALIVFLLARMEVLPRKSLPYVAAGVAGAFGIGIFNAWRRRVAKDDLAKAEQAVRDATAKLPALKGKSDAAVKEAEAIKIEHEVQMDAYRKSIGQTIAEGEQKKAELGKLHGAELLDAVEKLLADGK